MKLLIPPPIVALACAAAIWALARFVPGFEVHFPGQRIAAFGLIGLGLLLDASSIAAFLRARTTVSPLSPEKSAQLVTTGFYRFTRNPMYLGLLLLLAGFALLQGSALAPPVLAIFIAYITTFQIKPEEERLGAIFGEDYERYKQRVRRWI